MPINQGLSKTTGWLITLLHTLPTIPHKEEIEEIKVGVEENTGDEKGFRS